MPSETQSCKWRMSPLRRNRRPPSCRVQRRHLLFLSFPGTEPLSCSAFHQTTSCSPIGTQSLNVFTTFVTAGTCKGCLYRCRCTHHRSIRCSWLSGRPAQPVELPPCQPHQRTVLPPTFRGL